MKDRDTIFQLILSIKRAGFPQSPIFSNNQLLTASPMISVHLVNQLLSKATFISCATKSPFSWYVLFPHSPIYRSIELNSWQCHLHHEMSISVALPDPRTLMNFPVFTSSSNDDPSNSDAKGTTRTLPSQSGHRNAGVDLMSKTTISRSRFSPESIQMLWQKHLQLETSPWSQRLFPLQIIKPTSKVQHGLTRC